MIVVVTWWRGSDILPADSVVCRAICEDSMHSLGFVGFYRRATLRNPALAELGDVRPVKFFMCGRLYVWTRSASIDSTVSCPAVPSRRVGVAGREVAPGNQHDGYRSRRGRERTYLHRTSVTRWSSSSTSRSSILDRAGA